LERPLGCFFVELGSKRFQAFAPSASYARLQPLLLAPLVQMSKLDMSQAAEQAIQGELLPRYAARAAPDRIGVDLNLVRSIVE
jgi:hypothetical protein